MSELTYSDFIYQKSQLTTESGFAPLFIPDKLFDFQKFLVDWSLRNGRSAIFADCGMGKSAMQLTWAENVLRKKNKPVLILTPISVGHQTVREGEKFGIESIRSRNGEIKGPGIYVSNYEQLHKFNPRDFAAVVCDESGILKHFSGSTQKAVTFFMNKMQYRLLCTATPSPNDYSELGTSSEALGYLGFRDMLSRFFKVDDRLRSHRQRIELHRKNKISEASVANGTGNVWRMKGHAEDFFWRWVCSWARACRKPSDIGFDDSNFILPELIENEHIIIPKLPSNGMLFTVPAIGFAQEREERKRTLKERCEYAAALVDHNDPAVIWCHYNPEGDLLEEIVKDSIQVSGADSDEKKEEAFIAFESGQVKKMIIKPKIGAWGLNWQHCGHVVSFVTHSFEGYYQSLRRCLRFGRTSPVRSDIIATEGEKYVMANMRRKSDAMDKMFEKLISNMNNSLHINRTEKITNPNIPSWIKKN